MIYHICKSDDKTVGDNLEALEGVFIFPSRGYELNRKNTVSFSIECILISYDGNNDRLFKASFIKHLERIDKHTFYGVLDTDKLIHGMEINLNTDMVNFITKSNYNPFLIINKSIYIPDVGEKSFEDCRYGNISRFVGINQFNPLFILLEKFECSYIGKTEYQTQKLRNAIVALRWIISCGFPYKKIIHLDKNEIVDTAIMNKIFTDDVPFDSNFIEGNPKYRFCRLIQFGLKEFASNNKKVMDKVFSLDLIDEKSSLIFFNSIKKPMIRVPISNTQPLNDFFVAAKNKNLQKPEIYSSGFIVTMRITQPEKFTERLLEEARNHPTMLKLKWQIKEIKTLAKGKQRYNIHVYSGKSINILDLSKKLDDVRKFNVRLLSIAGLDEQYITPQNIDFGLNYLEITIPNINKDITAACAHMLNQEFLIEQKYSRKFERMYDTKRGEFTFRLGFGQLSTLSASYLSRNRLKLNKFERADIFTKTAINYALSGKYIRGINLLYEIDELYQLDDKYNMPSQFYRYIINKEKHLIPYLTKKHPSAFLSDDDYNVLKTDVEFFVANYQMFIDVEETIDDAIRSTDKIEHAKNLNRTLKYLGVYKEKDLSYLDDVCHNLSLIYGAKYRKLINTSNKINRM